jgi:Arc/MetJ-type ribon-helix-helix transcriptional regulator
MAPAERSGPEDEKVTINLGPVDLGRIDLLVREGVFSSRTDFIRDAIRDQLEDQKPLVDEVVTRKDYVVGYLSHSKSDLEKLRRDGQKRRVRVVGVYRLGEGITRELAEAVLEEVNVLGSLKGPKDVVDWIKSRRGEDA